MVNEIFEKFSQQPQVEAIVLGGSRASGNADEKSDYDVYVYIDGEFDEKIREEILSQYCSQMEIGNKYWEYEDNCILNNGVGMDIIYRTIDRFDKFIGYVVNDYFAQNGYSTCFW
ncbi:MAG: nucleotidyltransferase domain-containing protein, partial [Ruminococcus sp.]|nr:nucleotidyltransferase domain-containing protein [Ruminococcus sp.]